MHRCKIRDAFFFFLLWTVSRSNCFLNNFSQRIAHFKHYLTGTLPEMLIKPFSSPPARLDLIKESDAFLLSAALGWACIVPPKLKVTAASSSSSSVQTHLRLVPEGRLTTVNNSPHPPQVQLWRLSFWVWGSKHLKEFNSLRYCILAFFRSSCDCVLGLLLGGGSRRGQTLRLHNLVSDQVFRVSLWTKTTSNQSKTKY